MNNSFVSFEDQGMDRVLLLEPIDGKPLSSKGVVDPRLFTGENKLHAIRTDNDQLWSFKYEAGAVPEPLKDKFTSFSKLLKHAEVYFSTRNVRVKVA